MRAIALSAAGLCAFLVAGPATAQIRGDVEAYGGVSQRVLVNPGGGAALPGPMAGLSGHFALFPLLRLGLYVHGELAPTDDPVATTMMIGGGARAKITPPWPRGNWRSWLALGVGYVAAYSPSYSQPARGQLAALSVDGAGGGFLEIPLSVGISYRVAKPLFIFAELTTRFGLVFSGSLYDCVQPDANLTTSTSCAGDRGAHASDGTPAAIGQRGNDVFAAGLALGLGFDL